MPCYTYVFLLKGQRVPQKLKSVSFLSFLLSHSKMFFSQVFKKSIAPSLLDSVTKVKLEEKPEEAQ